MAVLLENSFRESKVKSLLLVYHYWAVISVKHTQLNDCPLKDLFETDRALRHMTRKSFRTKFANRKETKSRLAAERRKRERGGGGESYTSLPRESESEDVF